MATRPNDVGAPSVIETARLRLEPWSDAHFEQFARVHARPGRDPLHPRSAPRPGERDRAARALARRVELYGFGKRAIIEAATSSWLGFVELSLVGPGRARVTTTSSSATSCAPTAGGRASPPSCDGEPRRGLRTLRPRRADRTLPGRERRLRAGAGQGRLPAASPLRARRRHRRRHLSPPACLLGRRPRAIGRASSATAGPPPARSTVRRGSTVAVFERVNDDDASSTTSFCWPGGRDGSA